MDAGVKSCRCHATHLRVRPSPRRPEFMTPPPSKPGKHLVLVGGGHAHVFVLEAFARKPEPGLRLTLVARARLTPYSGMLPGHMAGIYPRAVMQIDLEPLARRSGAALVQDEAIGFDRAGKRVLLKSGEAISYDCLSVDIGVTPDLSDIDGAGEHALAIKPIGDLLAKWDRLVRHAETVDGPRRFVIVGAGVAGVCLAFAVSASLRARVGAGVHVALIGASVAPDLNARIRRRIIRALERRGVALHIGEAAVAIDPGGVTLAGGRRIWADAVLVSTRAAPPPAIREATFAKDPAGFLAIGPTLQVLNDDAVFAAGDCATMTAHPRPKAGVFAVRQGPALAQNLRRALRGETLASHVPQRDHLVLIGTGDGRAIGGRGRFLAFEGRLAWRLKDWLDRRFMRRFA